MDLPYLSTKPLCMGGSQGIHRFRRFGSVDSQPIRTFVLKAIFSLRIRATNRLLPAYELCSAWSLIVLSMPEKMIA